MSPRILVVDDDQAMCDLLETWLTRAGYRVTTVTSGLDGIDALAGEDFDAVLTDVVLPDIDGVAMCERALGTRPGLPVIVMTGQGTMELAVAALRAGAYDFVTKPLDQALVEVSLARATQRSGLSRAVLRLQKEIDGPQPVGGIIGESTPMKRVFELIRRVGPTDATVLIHGETGTGKELVARAIHDTSAHRRGPFVAINCAAVPPNLLESELFGHVRGAYTDAKGERTGLFVQANRGTLFLDEIGELPIDVQPKLLRALQERVVRPLGSNTEIAFDARIVTATNRDLEADVDEKRFREDLYYRINVVRIDLPPLRERGKDVVAIARAILDRLPHGKKIVLPLAVVEKLVAYNWPGNVRELENCMERSTALTRGEMAVEDLPDRIAAYRPPDGSVITAVQEGELVTLEQLERRYIVKVLAVVNGHKTRAASILGLDRKTLYRKLEAAAGEAPAR